MTGPGVAVKEKGWASFEADAASLERSRTWFSDMDEDGASETALVVAGLAGRGGKGGLKTVSR